MAERKRTVRRFTIFSVKDRALANVTHATMIAMQPSGGELRHAQFTGDLSALIRALLENALSGRVITVDLLLADDRQRPAARGECSTPRAHSERLTELAIFVCNRAFKVFVCGDSHGGTGDEKRVQPKSYQRGKE